MDDTLGEALSSINQERQPKLRASCDVCAAAKVKCSKERPICERCFANSFECNYSPSMKLGKPARRSELNVEGTPPLEVSKIHLSDQLPTATRTPDGGIHTEPVHHAVEQHHESTDSSIAEVPALGYYTFTWRYPGEEVFVTGSFDGWSKSVQLDRQGELFKKGVNLPRVRTTYKFVVDDVWMLDPESRTEEYDEVQGIYNNVLLPDDIAHHRWVEIKNNAAQRAAQGQTDDPNSGDESIKERVARIKARVVELTRSEKETSSEDPPVQVLSAESLEFNEQCGQTETSVTLQKEATSANPKLDHILAQVDDASMRNILERHDVSDLWLPIPRQTVKRLLADERKTKAFLYAQDDVMDSGFRLLNNSPSLSAHAPSHTTIDDDEGLVTELRVLGEGACGIVEEVEVAASTGTTTVTCVRKRIARPRQLKALKQIMAAFSREVSVMRQVDHHHCVRFIGSYTDVDHISILSSPVADMDLAAFLDLPVHDKERDILYRGFGCLCNAINYLHQKNIRHEDLKPQNVLIHGDNLLLTDFGFSLDFSDDSVSTTTGRPSAWTVRYSAPEVLDFEPRSRATDIWSLGCVLLEMHAGFNGVKLSAMKEKWKHIGNGQTSFARNSAAVEFWTRDRERGKDETWNVRLLRIRIRTMLKSDRLQRPTSQQIVDNIGDISLLMPTQPEHCNSVCHGVEPCIGLSSFANTTNLPQEVVDVKKVPHLNTYLYPRSFDGWQFILLDRKWNVLSSNHAILPDTESELPEWILENAILIAAACDEIYHTANRKGTTKSYWRAHDKTSTSLASDEAKAHAISSAEILSVKHVVFKRLTLSSRFWSSPKPTRRRSRVMQMTLLPICLARSKFFGSFFWMFSWPTGRKSIHQGDEIMDDHQILDMTGLDWPY